MATQVFSDEELGRLRGFPEIGRDELHRFFTLTPADVAFVDPGRGRGPADRLGLAVALRTLPWLGFVPYKVSSVPPLAVARLSKSVSPRTICGPTGAERRPEPSTFTAGGEASGLTAADDDGARAEAQRATFDRRLAREFSDAR